MALSVPSFFSQNSGTKVVALLLALVVYAHVYTEQEQEIRIDIPLRVEGLPPGLVLAQSPPGDVTITARGKGKQLIKLRVSPPRMVVDLAEARPGEVQRMLSPADVDLPVGLDALVTGVVEPRMVQIRLDSLVTRRARVEVPLIGQLPAGYVWDEPVRVEPPEVTLHGPSEKLASLEVLVTSPLDLSDVQSAQGREIQLLLPEEEITADPPAVGVILAVSPVRRRQLPPLPVRITGVEDHSWVRAIPESVRVTIAGPRSLVDGLDPSVLELKLDGRGLGPGRHRVPIQIGLPDEKIAVTECVPPDFLLEIAPPSQ